MTTTDTAITTTQVYRVYIKATADAIWTAITDPEWTNRYGYTRLHALRPEARAARSSSPRAPEFKAEAEAAGYPCPDVLIDGEVLEADAPHRLVTTWRMLMDPATAAEPALHDHLRDQGARRASARSPSPTTSPARPLTAALVSGGGEDQGGGGGGGHAWVLSDLKSLLETGATMAG